MPIELFPHIKEKAPISQVLGIILAGGQSHRMQPLIGDRITKLLLPVSYSSSLLDTAVTNFRRAGIRDIVLVISNQTANQVLKHGRQNSEKYDGVTYFNPNTVKPSLSHILHQMEHSFALDKPIIKADGDQYIYGLDIERMYSLHQAKNHEFTYAVTEFPNPKYRFVFNPTSNLVEQVIMEERDKSQHLGSTGLAIINPKSVHYMLRSPSTREFLQQAVIDKKLYVYPFQGNSININYPRDYKRLIESL